MSVKLISYDLGGPENGSSYNNLITAIKDLGTYWAKPMESLWLVDCNKSCIEIRSILNRYLDSNDRLIVMAIPLTEWASLNLPDDVVNWMKKH